MANYLTTDTELTSVANAIRTKGGTSSSLEYPSGFVTAINNIPTGTPINNQNKSKSYTPSETAQSETVTADTGYTGLGEVAISVGAISSSYVGSGITRRSSSDLTASGATVTAPSGYYSSSASKSVTSGSATTPATTITANPSISVNSSGLITATASATKSVTPTVSAGYVSSGTAGTITVSGSNTSQLSTQAAQTIYPSTTDQTISSGKYLTGTQTIKAVSQTNLAAENIKSGTTVSISNGNGNIWSVTGTYTGGGTVSKNTQVVQGTTRTSSSTKTAIGAEMTVSKTGTYDVYWSAFRSNTSSSYTYATQLYIDGTAYGSENTTWTNHVQNIHLSNVSLTANQKIRVYGRESRGSSYYIYAPTLVIVEA